MPGYYGKKWSTIRLFLRWRSKRKARWLVREGHDPKKEINKILELIRQHYVRKSQKLTDKEIKEFKKLFHSGFQLLLLEEFQEDKALAILKKIEDVLIHIEQNKIEDKNVKEFENFIKKHLVQSLSAADQFDRKSYKDLLKTISEAEVGGRKDADHQKFMTTVMNALKKMDVSNLARFPFYTDIRREQQDIVLLRNILSRLKKIEKLIKNKKYKELTKDLNDLETIFGKNKDPVYDTFYRAYAIKHRDFVILLMALEDEDILKAIIEDDVVKLWYPELVGKKEEEKMENARLRLRQNLQIIAQAERIFIHQEERLIKKAKAL